MITEKEIRWVGSAYDDLLAFPQVPRKEAGFQLAKVQGGLDPTDWKPFDDIGTGTKEVCIKDATGIYRVMFVAKFEEAVYVRHCFQKNTGDQQAGQDDCRSALPRRRQSKERR